MRVRRAVAWGTVLSFMFVYAVPGVRAAEKHSVTSAQLHQAVQASHAQAAASRVAINSYLDRADVQRQFSRLGLSSETVRARVSMLGDAEVLRLHQQMMSADLQQARAGLSSGAIVAIVLVAVGGALILFWILLHEIDEELDDDYYYWY